MGRRTVDAEGFGEDGLEAVGFGAAVCGGLVVWFCFGRGGRGERTVFAKEA